MRRAEAVLLTAALTVVTSCGQPLGEYEIDAVRVTTYAPFPEGVYATNFGRYLKVELSSQTSLTAISQELDGVYAHADFCPFSDPYALTAFGPFSDEDADLGVPSAAAPLQKGSDGRFHYNVFIVPKHPMPGVEYSRSGIERRAYDIGTTQRDLCLKFDAPGYNIIPSKSKMIRVPHEQVKAALSSAT